MGDRILAAIPGTWTEAGQVVAAAMAAAPALPRAEVCCWLWSHLGGRRIERRTADRPLPGKPWPAVEFRRRK